MEHPKPANKKIVTGFAVKTRRGRLLVSTAMEKKNECEDFFCQKASKDAGMKVVKIEIKEIK